MYLRGLREFQPRSEVFTLECRRRGRAGRDHESEAARFPALIAPQSSEAQLKFPRKFLIRSGYLSRRATVARRCTTC